MTHPAFVQTARPRRMRATALACGGVALAMVALAFAAVPLYRLFCQATGFAGTPRIGASPAAGIGERAVSVRFDANVAPGIAWTFAPESPTVLARLGETKTVFYRITNPGKQATTGIATFNVQPERAGGYFVKIQCFCFTEQTLGPGETMEAPVVFYLDQKLGDEPSLDTLATITLSYTVFPAKDGRPVATTAGAEKPKS